MTDGLTPIDATKGTQEGIGKSSEEIKKKGKPSSREISKLEGGDGDHVLNEKTAKQAEKLFQKGEEEFAIPVPPPLVPMIMVNSMDTSIPLPPAPIFGKKMNEAPAVVKPTQAEVKPGGMPKGLTEDQILGKYNVTQEELGGIQDYVSSSYVLINALLRNAGKYGKMELEALKNIVNEWDELTRKIDFEEFARTNPEEYNSQITPEVREALGRMNDDEIREAKNRITEIKDRILKDFGKTNIRGDPASFKELIQNIEDAVKGLEKIPSFANPDPESGITLTSRVINAVNVRLPTGETLLEFYQSKMGGIIREDAFFSSSGNIAGTDTLGNRDTIVLIECPQGHKGKDISGFTKWGEKEKEILFPPGSEFEVLSVNLQGEPKPNGGVFETNMIMLRAKP